MSENNDVVFADIDDLLNASMDDLDDLPPIGVPPSGHYNLTVSFSIEEVGDDKRKTIFARYIIDAINELKDEDDRSDVTLGQTFREGFYLTKKDGTPSKFGMGTLKARLAPHAARFNTTNIGELISQINQVAITATIKRTVNRKQEDQFNMQMKDIVLL